MAEDRNVSIVEWPATALALEHEFLGGTPCPVSIAFATDAAVRVVVATDSSQPLDVNMNMQVSARQPLPLCLSICEPICARSDYVVNIAVFDNPVAAISVRGLTRLFDCRDEPQDKTTCAGFDRLKPPTEFAQPFTNENLNFAPLGGPLRAATFGDPAGKVKLAFPPAGMRITFPFPVRNVRITVNSYAGPGIDFGVYAGTSLVASFHEPIVNAAKTVALPQDAVTAIEVKGGNNESAVVDICYSSMQR